MSISVCVRNGAKWIEGCLEALLQQTYANIEILAVNDGSTDGAEEVMARFSDPDGTRGFPVRIHHQPPLGLSAGRKWALEAARGEWFAITDIDVRPEPDWIANLLLESEPISHSERIVAVTGRTVFEQATDLVSRLRAVEIASKYRSRPRRTSLANGPCSMFHREALLEVGGFNPDWYHAEDMEVSLRLMDAGGTIVYAPNAIVRHVPETGLSVFLAKRKRDARAHVRIMRHFPSRKRQGPGFDFLGSSSMVLCLLPLWLMIAAAGIPFCLGLAFGQFVDVDDYAEIWEIQVLSIAFFLLVFHELLLWRGPLGLVNREVMRTTSGSKIIAMFGVRWLTIRWSLALWYGLLLGYLDAIRKVNGH